MTSSRSSLAMAAGIRKIGVDEEIQAAEESLHWRLLEAAPDAMVVVDQHGDIVLLNRQAERLFGHDRNELLGRPVTTMIPHGFAERLIADQRRSTEAAWAQQIGTGIELSGRRKDGSTFPIEIMLSPLGSTQGILVIAAIRDLSERKAAETHLARMEARYRGLLEAAPDAMVVVDQGGDIVLLNRQAERLLGHDRAELLGRPVTTIIPHGFAERLLADQRRSPEVALAQQIDTGLELSGRRKDGTTFPIEIMLSPLDSDEGIMVTAAIRDISARKAAEQRLARKTQELARSNEELTQFALIASHDLQAPLRAVSGFAQLLSRRYKGKFDADADAFIEFTVGGTARMQRLIDDLLAYACVGTKIIDRPNASSESALREALANLHSAIEDSAAQVTHDPMPSVSADETQLVQLFQNLIGNAIKHHGGGVPSIHVSAAKHPEGDWIFSVKDNGPGIKSQYFEQIFGMFQRLDTRQEFSGTGIGLAICRKIVERHGGSIWVESPPGKGATFRFALSGGDRKS